VKLNDKNTGFIIKIKYILLVNGKICIKSYGSFYMTAENYGGRDITCHR